MTENRGQSIGAGHGSMETDAFFRQYTSHDEILKYTKATAGLGISYLLDHDYKAVYLEALAVLPQETRERGIRMLEFGCGGGMNLLHLISVLHQEGIKVENAIGTDFSPVMIETARREAKNYLSERDLHRLEFHVAKNESLISNLSASAGTERAKLEKSFDFILGVNTIRYCHDAKTEMDNARDIFDLLVPGGVCVVIDMNNRFPLFRSDLKNGLRWKKEKQCYVPSLEEYTAPFVEAGFEILRSEHFCWVPHSAGGLMCALSKGLSPLLNRVAKSRAMRSLVVSRRPR
ncbi:MAG: class I SAM-dependent methyltransferase [Candidatus Acidiferrum sp.]